MPPVSSIMEDPLAGCLPLMRVESNAQNMLGSMLMRLRIFYSEPEANTISESIIAEVKNISIYHWEYVINEVMFEFRRVQKKWSEQYEENILNQWTTDLLKRHQEDAVWSFFRQVKANRLSRKRTPAA